MAFCLPSCWMLCSADLTVQASEARHDRVPATMYFENNRVQAAAATGCVPSWRVNLHV